MRVRTPSLRLRSVHVHSLNYFNDNTTNPHFDMTLVAEIAVRNKNFGHFRFDNATANVTYGGVRVGDGEIVKGRARARSTKRMNVTIEVMSSNERSVPQSMAKLSGDIRSGNLTLTSVAELRGKVTLMKVIKKKKTAHMNCTMTVNLGTKSVRDLRCQ
ncbi:late embryogenesis abundant protein At1g64065-like [Humulus lupulus]|uniref:late embryogenesis abundant protein At1g64065-like n=1 Tax=Humulus lupulus TaxID=3486 RepID=UPI002B404D4B|nr:late embryogenesis abundant protein At1g64065-like [Humulus lupulus]